MANQPSKESLAQLLSYASDSSDGSHLSTPVRDGLGAFVRYGEEANDHAVHQEPTEKPVSPNTASLDNSQPSSPPRDATLPPLTSPEPSAAPLTQRQQLLCPPAIPDVEEWGIPSEPPGAADPDVQARFNQWQAMMADGADFNTQLFGNKSFRNPHLCAKFIEFLELDEFGSNFSTTVFDPHALSRAQYLEDMAQANHHKAAADRTRTTIDFVTSRRSNAKEHSATRSGSTEKARARLAANSLTSGMCKHFFFFPGELTLCKTLAAQTMLGAAPSSSIEWCARLV
ncbi:hypothetical protein H4R34_003404 [Dimargaris verticillata]|uniref:Uncharacterized protein n=1 Tax=Dimargaris verticillata TaxID=2761393 RepID=A0A9W8B0R9_9FUNG|nr:hypothetical protein H4R34_003404 [Dimargaris verticillata]